MTTDHAECGNCHLFKRVIVFEQQNAEWGNDVRLCADCLWSGLRQLDSGVPLHRPGG